MIQVTPTIAHQGQHYEASKYNYNLTFEYDLYSPQMQLSFIISRIKVIYRRQAIV